MSDWENILGTTNYSPHTIQDAYDDAVWDADRADREEQRDRELAAISAQRRAFDAVNIHPDKLAAQEKARAEARKLAAYYAANPPVISDEYPLG